MRKFPDLSRFSVPSLADATGGAICSASFLALDLRQAFEHKRSRAPDPLPNFTEVDEPPPITTSVLVHARDHGEFIEDCIESLLVQTILPDEIIVYDDGSVDDTVERLRHYETRIILLEGRTSTRPPHLRHAKAVETAFKRSAGKYIFLLNGSDRFKRRKIEQYLSVFASNPDAALVQAPMDKIDQHGRIVGSNLEPRKHVVEHLKEIYRKQDVDFFYPTSALAFSRPYLDAVLPLDFSDGLPLWLDTRLGVIAPYFGRVITLPDMLTEWRLALGPRPARPRKKNLPVRLTLMRTQIFNRFCRRYGLRTISAWRNTRFYLQLLRLSLPDAAYRLYRFVRPRLSGRF